MKKIVIFLGHPAHYHLFKNVAHNLQDKGVDVMYAIKKKDILVDLVSRDTIPYEMIREDRKSSLLGMIWSVVTMEWRMWRLLCRNKADMLVGTTLSFASRIFARTPVISCNEDDADVVPRYAKLVYPFANEILAPTCCDCGKWNTKATKYPSYHELAYLHPNHFMPSCEVVDGYGIDTTRPYFILRFASLHAHHDGGIGGINTKIAQDLIDILKPVGSIYITSERPLEPQFEQYRIRINPLDMHHVMAFASLYIGDSQTMAAEAGVLGTPFIRFNDFVGRIGYLRELEDVYQLGIGIRASSEGATEKLYAATRQLAELSAAERTAIYSERREKMLAEKIDLAQFLTWFIEEYPESKRVMQEQPEYQYRFR